jgi:hypothetical protein
VKERIVPRPTNREDLMKQAEENFEKMMVLVDEKEGK